jgi:hypothetical protein
MEGTFRQLPGLGVASIKCSGLRSRRSAERVANDDLLFDLTFTGKRTISQRGREAAVGEGEAAMLSDADTGVLTLPAETRFINFRVSAKALASRIADLNTTCGDRSRATTRHCGCSPAMPAS